MVKQLIQQIVGIWAEGTATQKLLGALSVLVVGMGLWAAVFLSTRPDHALLFGNLDPSDAAQVVETVRSAGIEAEVRAGGSAVYVPRESVAEMRMIVSSAGLPRGSGSGWELFDKSSFGVSDFEQGVMYRRALEGELSRSIATFDGVENARVSITKPKRSAFVGTDTRSKASVVVRTKHGRELSTDNVAAIRHLIAGAVEELEPSRVSVLDTRGRVLSEPEQGGLSAKANDQVELRQRMEQYLLDKAQVMLDQVGVRAVVQVSLDMDFQQFRQTSEKFSPEGRVMSETVESNSSKPTTTGGQGPVGSEKKIDEGLNLLPGGGVANESNEEKIETQYKLDRVVTSEETTSPKIERMTVSMFLHKEHQENMAKIEGLVKAAVGFDANRGDLMESMPLDFGVVDEVVDPVEEEATPGWMSMVERGIQILGVLGALVILFLALRMPERKMKQQILEKAEEDKRARAAEVTELAERMESELAVARGGGPEVDLRAMVKTTVESDPSAATRVLRSWLRDGNPN